MDCGIAGMKHKTLYSRATRRRSAAPGIVMPGREALWEPEDQGPRLGTLLWQKTRAFCARHDRAVPAAAAVLVTLLVMTGWRMIYPIPQALTQFELDNAVKFTLANTPPGPAESTVAAAIIAPSVVRVEGYYTPEHAAAIAKAEAVEARKLGIKKSEGKPKSKDDLTKTPTGDETQQHPDTIGSGVVITEKGDILTNLHVVSSTDRWVVVFADGSKSGAILVSTQPENDLAMIRANKLPDELKPAALASTRDILPGDMVVAVGFPFGIGPSVSAGVVAGLKRSFEDPTDPKKSKLTNLVQFDAAVNPGNSGGPLVNRDGEVVGIVTAIYNPTGLHVFAGMAFAVPIENAAMAAGNNPL